VPILDSEQQGFQAPQATQKDVFDHGIHGVRRLMPLRNPPNDILSSLAATGARVVHFFVKLLDGTAITIRTLGSEIGFIREAILRHTGIPEVQQRLTLGGRELRHRLASIK